MIHIEWRQVKFRFRIRLSQCERTQWVTQSHLTTITTRSFHRSQHTARRMSDKLEEHQTFRYSVSQHTCGYCNPPCRFSSDTSMQGAVRVTVYCRNFFSNKLLTYVSVQLNNSLALPQKLKCSWLLCWLIHKKSWNLSPKIILIQWILLWSVTPPPGLQCAPVKSWKTETVHLPRNSRYTKAI